MSQPEVEQSQNDASDQNEHRKTRWVLLLLILYFSNSLKCHEENENKDESFLYNVCDNL